MDNKMICGLCGLIIEENQLKEICPVCGVKKAAFKPYQDRVSEKRRKYLQCHFHSLIIHLPQAAAVLITALLAFKFVLPQTLQPIILSTVHLLSVLLPLMAIAGLFSGLLEGKFRFKRLDTPWLKLKIIVSSLFIGLSMIMSIQVVFFSPHFLLHFLLSLSCTACAVILGHKGGQLINLEVPG
jgi:rubredoxin